MRVYSTLARFILPPLRRRFFLRLLLVCGLSWICFSSILIPLRIQGSSMEPTYHDGAFAFCLRPRYPFSDPKPGDVVTVRFAGKDVMLLKRIVALQGDTVAFRNGKLYRNGHQVLEAYVSFNSGWQLEERTVKPDHVYVVGDNRGTAINIHKFGQVKRSRIVGGVFP